MPTEEDRCGPARLVTSHGALGSWVSYLDVGNTGGCKWKLNLKLVSCQFLFFCLVYGYSLQRVFGLSFGYLDNPIIVWSYRSIFQKSFKANLRSGRCGQLPTSIKTPGLFQRSSHFDTTFWLFGSFWVYIKSICRCKIAARIYHKWSHSNHCFYSRQSKKWEPSYKLTIHHTTSRIKILWHTIFKKHSNILRRAHIQNLYNI